MSGMLALMFGVVKYDDGNIRRRHLPQPQVYKDMIQMKYMPLSSLNTHEYATSSHEKLPLPQPHATSTRPAHASRATGGAQRAEAYSIPHSSE